jgi:hypothetical protein
MNDLFLVKEKSAISSFIYRSKEGLIRTPPDYGAVVKRAAGFTFSADFRVGLYFI